MYATGTKKMLILLILKILEKYSDEQHPLTQKRIIELLNLEYGMECDRRSVSKNISMLKELGYDIVKNRQGCFIIRDFDDAQLRLLIDSVLFSKNISRSQAKQLIEKLKSLGSRYLNAKVNHIYNLPELHHSDNTRVMSAINILNDAINNRKKVSFIYNIYDIDFKLHPRREEPYIVNPYQMVATNGHYYLIGNYDKYNNVSHYRIDRITEVKLLNEPVKPKKEVSDFANGFNLPKHMAEHIYMFSGESVSVKFKTYNFMMNDLIDWFGKDFRILRQEKDKILVSVRVNETAMKFWSMQFGEHVEILEPESLRKSIHDAAQVILNSHK